MSDVSTPLGRRATFEFDGVTYQLGPWDNFELQRQYETYLKRRAWDELFLAKSTMPPGEFEAISTAHIRDCAAGSYRWGGKVWWESLGNPDSHRHLMWLTLCYHHREVTLEAVHKMLVHPEKGQELQLLMKELVADPNLQMPALPPAKV